MSVSNPVPVIVGATGVGKTAVSLAVAEAIGGEVVSLDSRLFYRGMDIGTAKPTPVERARVRHHLIDMVEPDQTVSLAEVVHLANEAMDDIVARGCVPLLVGGTGQYVRALVEGWLVPEVPPNMDRRAALQAWAESNGESALHERLGSLDPTAARRIDPRNVRRVIRAIELVEATGMTSQDRLARQAPRHEYLIVGLTRPREILYPRLDQRLEGMLVAGLEEEVRGLLAGGFGFDLPAMSAVGYAEWRPYFDGNAERTDVEDAIRRNLRRLVRSQHAWFGESDPRITWFDAGDRPDTPEGPLVGSIRTFLASRRFQR